MSCVFLNLPVPLSPISNFFFTTQSISPLFQWQVPPSLVLQLFFIMGIVHAKQGFLLRLKKSMLFFMFLEPYHSHFQHPNSLFQQQSWRTPRHTSHTPYDLHLTHKSQQRSHQQMVYTWITAVEVWFITNTIFTFTHMENNQLIPIKPIWTNLQPQFFSYSHNT